ncbi:MAG TPA: hypothetical protein VFS67_03705 [Polyangiaceae bacterium]|nr:hypothetical protein [Polyangiaceae bacterium]
MGEWKIAHETLSRLARERAASDALEGQWLLRARRAQVHVHLGLGNFVSYVEQLFGYTPRSILEKLRVAEALEQLPASRAALEQGQLGWCAVRELTRVAVSETEEVWLQAARGKTVQQLEQLVAGKHRGDAPSDKPDPRAVRYVLRFEVTGETYALFREALLELRRRSSISFDDDAALLEMARCILGAAPGGPGGPVPRGRDEGRSSYQIAISVCPECGSGRQPANGQLVPIAPEIVDMAGCDAQRLPALEGNTPREQRPSPDAGTRGEHAEPLSAHEACPVVDAHMGNGVNELRARPGAFPTADVRVSSSVDEGRARPDAQPAAAPHADANADEPHPTQNAPGCLRPLGQQCR